MATIVNDDDLSPAMYSKLCALVYEQCGITLGEKKVELVKSRVSKRMRKLGIGTFRDYYTYLMSSDDEMVLFLDAMSTNTTHFFRESAHFDFMQEQLGKWSAAGQRKYRFWCAASSSGEEPYTMAMITDEVLKNKGNIDCRILATDISTDVLRKCGEGVYAEKQFIDMPSKYKQAYFRRENDQYRVSDELKKYITFNRMNLVNRPYPMKGPFDLIFCRNVMIYFDAKVRRELLMESHRLLGDDGYLMVGHAESLTGLDLPFKLVQPSVYQKI